MQDTLSAEKERLAEERRKLEADQARLREELDKLDKERYFLAPHCDCERFQTERVQSVFCCFLISAVCLMSFLIALLISVKLNWLQLAAA